MADSNGGWTTLLDPGKLGIGSSTPAASSPSDTTDGFSSLSNLSDSLNKQDGLLVDRQQTEIANLQRSTALTAQARQQTAVISEQSLQSAAASRAKQLELLGGIDTQLTKAKTAMALSDSQNPMDHLQLWALQQADPTGYTRAGNIARIQLLQDGSSALGTTEAIRQSGFQDQVTHIKNMLDLSTAGDADHLAMLKMAEGQGQERIDAAKADMATKVGFLQGQQSMQTLALSNLTQEQVAAATTQAVNSKNGMVNIGGVDISLASLQDRQAVLTDRAFNESVHQNATADLALSNLTMPQVQAAFTASQGTGSTVIGGIPYSTAKLQNRIDQLNDRSYQNTTQSLALNQAATALQRQSNLNILGKFTQPELTALMASGGVDPKSGIKFDLDQVSTQLNLKAAAATDKANQDAAMANVANPLQGAVGQQGYIDSIKASPGSPLSTQLAIQKQAVATASWGMMMSQDPQHKVLAAQVIASSRATVDNMVNDEAKRQSLGDKDTEEALMHTLRGQAIPAELIQTAVINRVVAGKPIGNWLSPTNRGTFMNTYNNSLATLTAAANSAGSMGIDKKTLQAQAAEEAFNAVKDSAVANVTGQVMAAQISDPTNPLSQVMRGKEGQLLSLIHEADTTGAKQFASENGLSDEGVATAGKKGDPDLAAAQASALYQALDKIQPGLGKSYTDWWNSDKRTELVARYADASMSGSSSFTDSSEKSLVQPDLQGSFATYGTMMVDGEKRALGADFAKQHSDFVTFGTQPSTKQVFLLQSTPGLSDTDRQQAYTKFIKPLVDDATKQNMNSVTAQKFIEGNLRTMTPDDPKDKRLLQSVLQGRDAALKIAEDYTALQPGPIPFISGPGLPKNGPVTMFKVTAGYDWWKELQGNQ